VDFVTVVDQVLALLHQRSRMTYRTLQRQFPLDDNALHALTGELLYAHPEVRDDAERVLVGVPRRESIVSGPFEFRRSDHGYRCPSSGGSQS